MKLQRMLVFSRRPFLFLAFFALLAVGGPAAQERGRTEYLQVPDLTGSRGGNMVLAIGSDPSSFNRMFASGLPAISVTDRISADLVHVNRGTLQIEPSLATRWETDKTGRIYTLHLRRGVRFSDNTPFTADDVVFSLQALTDPRSAAPLAGQIETDGTFPQVRKLGDYTVQLTFRRAVGMGLRMLDSVPMLPKARLNHAYRQGRFAEAWNPTVAPGDVAGLGPFRLREYQRGVKIVLERNPHYWKKDRAGVTLPYLDTLTFLVIPDFNSEALRFRQGELHLMNSPSLSPENYAMLRRTQDGYVLRDLGPGLALDYLWFNLNRGTGAQGRPSVDPEKLAVFEKSEFRRAVSHALDRDGMTRSILLGLGSPQYGPVSSGNRQWHNPAIPRTEYDPAHARKLLAQIGLRDANRDGILEYGGSGRPLDLSLFTSRGNSVREKAAQVIRDNLARIGIRVGIQHLLPNEIASRFLRSFDYDAILFGFAPTDVAPDLQTNLWMSSGSIHFWQPYQKKPQRAWEASLDGLISRLVVSAVEVERKASFDRAQEIWAREMPAIPTIAPDILVGWSRRLENVRPSVLVPHLVWNAEAISVRRR